MGSSNLPVLVLEALVVLIDGGIIKLLVTLNPFQGDDYRGVSLAALHRHLRDWQRPQLFHWLRRHPEAVGGSLALCSRTVAAQ